jgi:hypothetical protein
MVVFWVFLVAVVISVPMVWLAIALGGGSAWVMVGLFLAPFWFMWLKAIQWRWQARQLRHLDPDELLQRDPEGLGPDEESFLIEHAKAIARERKRKTDLAWARRVIGDEGSVERPSSGRKGIPRAVRHAVWSRDGARCVECGSSERLEFDHIIPLSRGGSNTERNIQLLCESCNRRKGATLG